MSYASCNWIESGLVLGHKDLKFCCLPHSDCTKGYVSICDYRGGPLPVAQIDEARRRLIATNARLDEGSPCSGCGHLRAAEWGRPEERRRFDWIGVESFFLCNLRCAYCDLVVHADWRLPDKAYDLSPVFRELLDGDLLAEGARIEWGGGEPTILDEFDALQQLLAGRDLRQLVNTNAVVFSEPLEKGLARGAVEVVTSVDSGTRATYKEVKGRDRFERVWANLCRYARTGGEVTAKYVLRRGNSDRANILGFVQRCAIAGIPRVALSTDLFEVEQDDVTEETAHAFGLLDRAARRRGIEVSIVPEYLPDDRERFLRYVPLRPLEWRHAAARGRAGLARFAGGSRARARQLLGMRETRRAVRRADRCLGTHSSDSHEVSELLERETRVPSAELRRRLLKLVATRRLPAVRLAAGVDAVGLSPDGWTLEGEACFVVVDNRRSEQPLAPALWCACHAGRDALPLTVAIGDGARDVRHTFHRPDRRRLALPAVPAGGSGVLAVRTDRTWTPPGGADERRLGVHLSATLEPA